TAVTDALGHRTSYQYDSHRRLQVAQDALNDLTTLGYDSTGNLNTTKDALGRVTTTTYDAKNRLTAVTDAAGGLWTISYNVIGEVTSEQNPLGNYISSRTYDQRGFLTKEIYAIGQPPSQTTTSAYDALGRMTTSTDANNHV